jgi:Family of unknown function (DUF6152)
MRRDRWRRTLAASAFLLAARALPAHHSVLHFDGARGVTLSGTVSRVAWQNPHMLLVLDVASDTGAVERWTIESESPLVLVRLGWTKSSVAAGDRVTVVGAPAKDGSRALRCQHVTVAGGGTLPCFP